MSYCRIGTKSDVYLYATVGAAEGDFADAGDYICQACLLLGADYPLSYWKGKTPKQALEHLLEHKVVGHKVPYSAIQRLEVEIKEASFE